MKKSPLKILIADDDAVDRKLIRRALNDAEIVCNCTEVVSVEEALDVCLQRVFDCVFIDYQLPGENGLEGISDLRQLHPYMAIIMSTGHGDEEVATEAIRRGATDYVVKAHIQPKRLRQISEAAVEKMALQKVVAEQREELECFANVLVHDLKAPIASMQGFAQIIAMHSQQGCLDKVVKHCQMIVSASKRMNNLINTLHEYTKTKADVAFTQVYLEDILEGALANLEARLRESGGCITHDRLPEVIGNAELLIQLFQNLIGNALKYRAEAKPTAHVGACALEDRSWQISVSDNGIGIPAEYHAAIFEPFKRGPDFKNYEGTGLGLATCKKIVERHGGRIWCTSELGRGTTFFLTLPESLVG